MALIEGDLPIWANEITGPAGHGRREVRLYIGNYASRKEARKDVHFLNRKLSRQGLLQEGERVVQPKKPLFK